MFETYQVERRKVEMRKDKGCVGEGEGLIRDQLEGRTKSTQIVCLFTHIRRRWIEDLDPGLSNI
jgi:hypothetical protein